MSLHLMCMGSPTLKHGCNSAQSVFRAVHRVTPRLERKLAVRCAAQQKPDSETVGQKAAAALLAASLLLGTAAFPGDALAARSGGRVGGSSFRSAAPRLAPAPRSAPRASPGSSGPMVRNYNYYSSPPLVGGYGYGYGGGGIGIFPSFGLPVYGLGSFFQFVVIAMVASAVLGAVRNAVNRRRDDYDDFD